LFVHQFVDDAAEYGRAERPQVGQVAAHDGRLMAVEGCPIAEPLHQLLHVGIAQLLQRVEDRLTATRFPAVHTV
jgi:hypothetical protein